ncbi:MULTISPECIES: hypothetical protein [Polaribacter]|uniref:DUF2971 domain-containing protein n=2 Tax=Polaribacter sejongensis TaxID=985043 RepID=A0AAJ1VG92_9FLAO|nr:MULTISPECIES: hypothetical protein [Polaribacter]MDN3619029.1 hypothetical protein [Polaribacter undariae]
MKNKISNIKFTNDEHISEDSFLWRYIDISKLLSFLINKSFFFTRLDKFEDKKEGITSNHLFYKKLKSETENYSVFDNIRNTISLHVGGKEMNRIDEEIKQIQKSNFANCWFIADEYSESVAMWNLYSSPNSVAIKIKYSEFKKNILKNGFNGYGSDLDIVCSQIKYVNFLNPNHNEIELIESVFLKDSSFNHENEFRLVLKKDFKEIPIEYNAGIHRKESEKLHQINEPFGYNLILNEFEKYNFEIVFHPKSQDWIKNDIKKILKIANVSIKSSNSLLEL